MFMRRNNVPKLIIRVLMVPLYPINLIFGIKERSGFLSCESEKLSGKSLLKIVYFFVVLPLLMNTDLE